MAIRIIRESDLDDKTIKVVGGKVAVPGAEIEVLDSFEALDTDTHYYVAEDKYLRHVETGAVWKANIAVKKERGTPVNEQLKGTVALTHVSANITAIELLLRDTSTYEGTIVSAIDDAKISDEVRVTRTDFDSAKEFNEYAKTHKYEFTTTERFATNGDKPKVLATTFEFSYPELPYKEGEVVSNIGVSGIDGSFGFNSNALDTGVSGIVSAVQNVEKTVHYIITFKDGKTESGTTTFTGFNKSIRELSDRVGLDGVDVVEKVKVTSEPFRVKWLYGDITVPASTDEKYVGDRL